VTHATPRAEEHAESGALPRLAPKLYSWGVVVHGIREFGGLRVETDNWPIIIMEFPEQRIDDESLRGCLEYIADILRDAERGGERSYQITDLTRMRELATASQRKVVADWMKRTVGLQKIASVGGANVTPSTMLRGLITAINWFQPPPMPTVFVATRKEAWREALKALDAAHVPVMPTLRDRVLG